MLTPPNSKHSLPPPSPIYPKNNVALCICIYGKAWVFREIAEMQDLPTQTIASRYRYALAKLRTALQTKPITTP